MEAQKKLKAAKRAEEPDELEIESLQEAVEDAQKSYDKEKAEADAALAAKRKKDEKELLVDEEELRFREQQALAAKGGIASAMAMTGQESQLGALLNLSEAEQHRIVAALDA